MRFDIVLDCLERLACHFVFFFKNEIIKIKNEIFIIPIIILSSFSKMMKSLENEEWVRVSTREGKVHNVPVQIAICSRVISTLLQDLAPLSSSDSDQTQQSPIIPLSTLDAIDFAHVLEWCRYYVEKDRRHEFCVQAHPALSDWERAFFHRLSTTSNHHHDNLFQLIMAANFLDIPELLDRGCKYVAELARGKSAAEMRDLFGLVNDFSPEEEQRIHRENAWSTFE